MLIFMVAACVDRDAVEIDRVTNRWWHLVDNNINIYLEQPGDALEGTLWYDFVGPDVPLEENWYGGEWAQVSDRRFSLEYFGKRYKVSASPSEEPGCYDLHLGLLADDLACPYEDVFGEDDEDIGGEA